MNTTTRRLLLALLLVFGLVAAACGDDDDSSSESETDETAAETEGDDAGETDEGESDEGTDGAMMDGPTIRVRGQDFSESVTIAEVYGQYLAAKGYDVDILTPAGFRVEAHDGIANSDLDLIIDYIGGAQANLLPDAEASDDAATVIETITPAFAEIGGTILEASPAVDGNAFVVRGDLEATSISDVADLGLTFGASAQCAERPQCLIGLEDPAVYGITFAEFVTIDFGPLLGEALAAEEVDAVFWNTTAPQIIEQGFKILDDDKGLFSAENIAPIVRTEVLDAYGDQLATDLNDLSAMITTDDLLAWNTETDIELRESDDVATEWLTEKGLL